MHRSLIFFFFFFFFLVDVVLGVEDGGQICVSNKSVQI